MTTSPDPDSLPAELQAVRSALERSHGRLSRRVLSHRLAAVEGRRQRKEAPGPLGLLRPAQRGAVRQLQTHARYAVQAAWRAVQQRLASLQAELEAERHGPAEESDAPRWLGFHWRPFGRRRNRHG